MSWKNLFVEGALVLTGVLFAGCGAWPEKAAQKGEPASKVSEHSEWWCNEHGVPEGICAQCDAKLVASYKAKNDWCKKHERPESQCFICHPQKEAEFAAEYEARYGKKPPKVETGADKDEKDSNS